MLSGFRGCDLDVESTLDQDYRDAWTEWFHSGEDAVWDLAGGDGLPWSR